MEAIEVRLLLCSGRSLVAGAAQTFPKVFLKKSDIYYSGRFGPDCLSPKEPLLLEGSGSFFSKVSLSKADISCVLLMIYFIKPLNERLSSEAVALLFS
jgi:hypothetical protein